MIKTRYSIKFHLYGRKRSDGTRTIRMSITWKSYRVLFHLPVSIAEEQWDTSSMMARQTLADKDQNDVNTLILEYYRKTKKLFDNADIEERIPSKDEVLAIFRAHETQKHPIPFLIDKFSKMQSRERGWVPITARKFIILERELRLAGLRYIEEMNSDGVQKYLDWITSRNYENAVAMKKVSILRWFLRWCRREDYLKSDDYMRRELHLRCPRKKVIYLTWDELLQLFYFNYGNYYALSNVRDVFCFCAFTGLRFSDAAQLRWDDVSDNRINVVTQKTAESLTIELNKYSREIINRCILRNKVHPSKFVLSAISIQKSNEHLKDCAMLAQIDEKIRLMSYRGSKREEKIVLKWEVLTTHCARRTFVVNALRLGISAEVIMKWTGHSDFKAMKPYVAIVDELKEKSMALFDQA